MLYHSILLSLSTALLVASHPHQQTKRQVTFDGTCGSPNGFTCSGGEPCCSQSGWCGATSEYCGSGCQEAFGTCDGGGGGGTPTSSQPTSSPSPPPTSGGGGGVRDIPRPKIGLVPYGSVITGCVNSGDIALTFDDGPYIYTAALLDLLARYSIKASFFVVGSNGNGNIDQVPEWSDLIRRMYSENHHVASHTYTHPDLTTLSSADRREQMYQNEDAFANILGVIPTYMRPPYLAFDAASGADMADLGYHVISTNLDTLDWANTTPETIGNAQNIFSDATDASPTSSSFIVLNHDIHRTTVYTLAEFEIQRILARGYRPVTVGACLGDSPVNWYRSASGTVQPAVSPVVGAVAARGISAANLEASGLSPPASWCDRTNTLKSMMRVL